MNEQDNTQQLQQRVEQALAAKTQLNICGGNSKGFYGRPATGEMLDVSAHSGVVNYEPTELVITARAGTPLQEIEQVLASDNQMLGFEPPAFAESATIGGTVACNLSGPRRAFSGSARDFVLGSTIINGKAEVMHFGGEVMKNVAGYDVSRLMCGAMGTLGVLLDVSLKVLPRPESEMTLVHELGADDSLKKVHQLARQSLPISATCFDENSLHIRLSGTDAAVKAARKLVGGDELQANDEYWQQLKEHKLKYFDNAASIWRLSLVSNAPVLSLKGKTLYEWNGAQRWLVGNEQEQNIREQVARFGGHAVCFRHCDDHQHIFHPLDTGLLKLHRRLKQAFDPDLIFNPGRMYPDI
ncbi:MAG: glycolate oxidase subunit GlcE [Gammaproteobacteria bacterium]